MDTIAVTVAVGFLTLAFLLNVLYRWFLRPSPATATFSGFISGRAFVAALPLEFPESDEVLGDDVVIRINRATVASETHALEIIRDSVGSTEAFTLAVERSGRAATVVIFRGSTRSDFIKALRFANLEKVTSILKSLSEATRAQLCQVHMVDEHAVCMPVLIFAIKRHFRLVAGCLVANGALENLDSLYSGDPSQFEENVTSAARRLASGDEGLILQRFLFENASSLDIRDDVLRLVVSRVGLSTVSATRDTPLIAAVKKGNARFAQKILEMDRFDAIYDRIMQGNLDAEESIDSLNISHRSPGSEWKNALELAEASQLGDIAAIIRVKVDSQNDKRIQILFYLCTLLSKRNTRALEWFKYFILPERRDVLQDELHAGHSSMFCLQYDGQFDGHQLSAKFRKGDTFLHVAARFETLPTGAFITWLLRHSQPALDRTNCEGRTPSRCASHADVRTLIKRHEIQFCPSAFQQATQKIEKNDFHDFLQALEQVEQVEQALHPNAMSFEPEVFPHPALPPRVAGMPFDVFISYRSKTESNFASALYCVLSAAPYNMKVFLDKHSLPIGAGSLLADFPERNLELKWMQDLYVNMYNSKIILILVSHEGIVAPFACLSSNAQYADACLAEHFFANFLNQMRTKFQPGERGVENNVRTILIGHPNPFVPLLDSLEYKELSLHIPMEEHAGTIHKSIEAVHLCVPSDSVQLSHPEHAQKALRAEFRTTKSIYDAAVRPNCIRPGITAETTYFGKLEKIANEIQSAVLSIPANYIGPSIENYVPLIKMRLSGSFKDLDEDDVKRAFKKILSAAQVKSINCRLRNFFESSIGLNVEILSPVESPLTCTDVVKRFLRAHRSGRLKYCCPPYEVQSVEVGDPLKLWPRIMAYEHEVYGTHDHPEVEFSRRELQASAAVKISEFSNPPPESSSFSFKNSSGPGSSSAAMAAHVDSAPAVVFGDFISASGPSPAESGSVLHHREAAGLVPSPPAAVQEGCIVSREFSSLVRAHAVCRMWLMSPLMPAFTDPAPAP